MPPKDFCPVTFPQAKVSQQMFQQTPRWCQHRDPLHILISVTAIECSHSAAGAQCDRNPSVTPACSALTGELSLSPTSIKQVFLYARIKVYFPRKPCRSLLSRASNRVKLTELCCIWEALLLLFHSPVRTVLCKIHVCPFQKANKIKYPT